MIDVKKKKNYPLAGGASAVLGGYFKPSSSDYYERNNTLAIS